MSEPGTGGLDAVIAALRSHSPHLYAVLDPASAPELVGWLRGSGLAHQCLFQGEAAASLAEEAPYLVHLTELPALRELVVSFHHRDAVTYLVSRAPFYAVRRHLRRIQYIQTVEGETLYFRFYDPRIARVFLPSCDAKQIRWMFGEVVTHWLTGAAEPRRLLAMQVAPEGETTVHAERVA